MRLLARPLSRLWSGLRDGVTPLGRAVLSTGLLALTIARITGLVELAVVAALCLLLVAVGVVVVLAPSNVRADLILRPDRTSTGVPVNGRLRLTNRWPVSVGRPVVEVPAGAARRWVRLPTLRASATQDAELVVPAPHRGVITVGPVLYRRTDPVGLFTRRVTWASAVELLVRPATVDLAGLPVGQLRDLEGVPSDQISMSDLAFHALREYVPGDDLRHVHWRSSARAGQLLVRQYHDSRRTSALLVVDTRPEAYVEPEDFELALSVAASITLRAGHDGYDLALVCGDLVVGGGPASLDPAYVLDAFCRSSLEREGSARHLTDQVTRGLGAAGDASMLFLLTGTAAPVDDLQRVVGLVPGDLWAGVWRAGIGEVAGLAEYAGRPIVTLGALDQLPIAMNEVVR
ncbi:MAG: DUF58 domain-containing protein [Nocardioides sp.]